MTTNTISLEVDAIEQRIEAISTTPAIAFQHWQTLIDYAHSDSGIIANAALWAIESTLYFARIAKADTDELNGYVDTLTSQLQLTAVTRGDNVWVTLRSVIEDIRDDAQRLLNDQDYITNGDKSDAVYDDRFAHV